MVDNKVNPALSSSSSQTLKPNSKAQATKAEADKAPVLSEKSHKALILLKQVSVGVEKNPKFFEEPEVKTALATVYKILIENMGIDQY